jgi:hypothetical protein
MDEFAGAIKSDAHKECCGIRQYEDGRMLFFYPAKPDSEPEPVCWLNAREAAEFPLTRAHRQRAA